MVEAVTVTPLVEGTPALAPGKTMPDAAPTEAELNPTIPAAPA